MDIVKKIIIAIVFMVSLPAISFAIPELYFYNNYLVGASFWTENIEFGDTPVYLPFIDSSLTIRGRGVVSFNNEHMSGGADNTALNVLNLDYITGKKVTLAPGEMVVVTSMSGEADNLYVQGILNYVYLGSNSPYARIGASNAIVRGSHVSLSTKDYTSATFNGTYVEYEDILDSSYLDGKLSALVQYSTVGDSALPLNRFADGSAVYLLANTSDTNSYISLSSTTVDLTDLGEYSFEKNLISQKVAYNLFAFATISTEAYVVFMPNLNYNIDIYFDTDNYNKYSASWNFALSGAANLVGNLSFNSSNTLAFALDKVGMVFNATTLGHDEIDTALYRNYAPIFINRLYGQYRYAIQINGGYIDINNYDELIQKLQEAGFGSGGGSGSGDLQRVIELIEEINTGGEKGAEVKELIGILEDYHEQLIQNSDFDSVTNVFDTYKNLLEFTDDMHWLITANNALFGYFAGFIMLCAMFLILNRIMR